MPGSSGGVSMITIIHCLDTPRWQPSARPASSSYGTFAQVVHEQNPSDDTLGKYPHCLPNCLQLLTRHYGALVHMMGLFYFVGPCLSLKLSSDECPEQVWSTVIVGLYFAGVQKSPSCQGKYGYASLLTWSCWLHCTNNFITKTSYLETILILMNSCSVLTTLEPEGSFSSVTFSLSCVLFALFCYALIFVIVVW